MDETLEQSKADSRFERQRGNARGSDPDRMSGLRSSEQSGSWDLSISRQQAKGESRESWKSECKRDVAEISRGGWKAIKTLQVEPEEGV